MSAAVPNPIAPQPHMTALVAPSAQRRAGASLSRTRPVPLQVAYNDSELTQVREAAEQAGLTPGGFIAAAGLAFAGARVPPPTSTDRALLREALELRGTLAVYAATLLQVLSDSRSDQSNNPPPLPLLVALNSCARAVDHVDAFTVELPQRVP